MARLFASLVTDARAQAERWPLWSSVCFGAGCGAYFTLKAEPKKSYRFAGWKSKPA